MLTKLTNDQIKLMDKVKQKWIDLSFTYKDLTWQELKPQYDWLYKLSRLNQPLAVIVLDSPFALQIGANLLSQVRSQVGSQVGSQVWSQVDSQVRSQVRSQVWSQVDSQVRSQVRSQVWSQVDSQVGSQVGSQVWSQVDSQVWSQVGSQVWSQVDSQVRSQVRSQVGSQVGSQVRSQVKKHIIKWFDCWESQLSSDSYWVSFYDYFTEIKVINNPVFNKYKELLETGVFMSILTDKFVFVCPAPTKAVKRSDEVFHNENGPAYEFKNGEKYYVLNGVLVPEWLVMTHSDQLDPQKVLQIENADQRAEGIRKLGIERLSKFGKVVDTYKNYDDLWFEKSEYELIDMSPIFKTLNYAPYLKMLNQSVPGVWHMEAVSKDCKTVLDAVKFRTKSQNPKIKVIK